MMVSSFASLAALSVAEFASKPFIQKALATPRRPESVLSFFYGVNHIDEDPTEDMRKGTPLATMQGIWYGANPEYDKLCQTFASVIREAGNKEFLNDPIWSTSIDGKVSQMLLCDQLARNCFRGSDEAFQYDSMAQELSVDLCSQFLGGEMEVPVLAGEMYPPYVTFMILPLMHSEAIENHQLGMKVVEYALSDKSGVPKHLHENFKATGDFLMNHKQVIDRFGRYPHRNKKLGRESTKEELAWLADTDNLPGWAKSQG